MSWKIELTNLLDALWKKRSREIVIGCVAKIEAHDTATMTADILPLLYYTDTGERRAEFAVIPDVPVQFFRAGGYFIRPRYSRGDLVWVSFATFDIHAPLRGVSADTGKSLFARENASVVMGLGGTAFSPPAGFDGDGIVIGHEAGNLLLEMTQERIRATTPVFEINGDLSVSGTVAAVGEIASEADIVWHSASTPTHGSTHTHPVPNGTSSSPNPGS